MYVHTFWRFLIKLAYLNLYFVLDFISRNMNCNECLYYCFVLSHTHTHAILLGVFCQSYHQVRKRKPVHVRYVYCVCRPAADIYHVLLLQGNYFGLYSLAVIFWSNMGIVVFSPLRNSRTKVISADTRSPIWTRTTMMQLPLLIARTMMKMQL